MAQDTNGRRDVYEYDTVTGEVHLLSDGRCDCDATFVDASPDGSNVFFTTRQQLSASTSMTTPICTTCVSMAGLLAQNQAPSAVCDGEECRGPAPSAPAFSHPRRRTSWARAIPSLPLQRCKQSASARHWRRR